MYSETCCTRAYTQRMDVISGGLLGFFYGWPVKSCVLDVGDYSSTCMFSNVLMCSFRCTVVEHDYYSLLVSLGVIK